MFECFIIDMNYNISHLDNELMGDNYRKFAFLYIKTKHANIKILFDFT